MVDVSAETVLEAAVVSTAELSFLLHAASANPAMTSVATLYPDPFLNIVLLLPFRVEKRAARFVAASFVFALCLAKSVHVTRNCPAGLGPDVVPNPCFLLQFPVASGKLVVGPSSITRPQSCAPILSSSPHCYPLW
jgi:hypothetical protein